MPRSEKLRAIDDVDRRREAADKEMRKARRKGDLAGARAAQDELRHLANERTALVNGL